MTLLLTMQIQRCGDKNENHVIILSVAAIIDRCSVIMFCGLCHVLAHLLPGESCILLLLVRVIIVGIHARDSNPHPQEAEDGYADEDESKEEEEEEVCLTSVKAFASSSSLATCRTLLFADPQFLCAGALGQRPSLICDAWTADAMLTEEGPM